MQTHEVTAVNALAHAEDCGGDGYTRWDREHCHSESLVQTRASVQDAVKARDVVHGQPRGALGRR
jgi:hypothetical protein